MSNPSANRYPTANGIPYYPKDPKGKETYILEGGIPFFLKKEGVGFVYAKDENGNEYYPYSSFSRQEQYFFRDRKAVYAVKRDGRAFYPKKDNGGEYIPISLDYIRDRNGSVRYPLDKRGLPNYPMVGIELTYVDDEHIGLDVNGEPVYIIDENGDEALPGKGNVGYNEKGEPYYPRKRNGDPIFPKDGYGAERYLKHREDMEDWIWMRGGEELTKYAKDDKNNEVYPKIIVGVQGFTFVESDRVLRDTYAVTDSGRIIYPRDESGNEFVIVRSRDPASAFPIGYPITNDDKYIVPRIENKPFLSDRVDPSVRESNVVALLFRQQTGFLDYLTNVKSKRSSTAKRKQYKTNLIPKVEEQVGKKQRAKVAKTEPLPTTTHGGHSYMVTGLVILMMALVAGLTSWLYRAKLQSYV